MTGRFDHLVFAALMTVVTVVAGGVAMVVAWAKFFMDPPVKVTANYSLALYLFSASVCVAPVGPLVGLVLPGNPRDALWTLSLLISFAGVTSCAVLVRKVSGPGAGVLWFGSATLFLVDLIGFIGMIMAIPGMPLNKG